MYAGEYQRAQEVLAEAEDLASQIHAVDQQFNVLIQQSQCWLRLDRWDEVLRIEAEWKELEHAFGQTRLGLTCFAVALGAVVRALRGELDLARSRRQASHDAMVAFTGPPTGWYRNQHY
jgi:alkylation response protein AidB-like acyl-CoA dehydrogenase